MAGQYFKSRFQIRAGLVLLLFDDFTDHPADENLFRIRSGHSFKVLKKQGGILVVVNPPEEPYDITIESPYYLEKTLTIQPENVCQMKKLRMIPGTGYPAPPGTVSVTGYAKPGSTVYLACDTGDRFLHLKEDYRPSDGRKLSLYCKEQAELEGKQICLLSENGRERCYLEEALEPDGDYRMDRAFSGTYSKIGTRVLPVLEGRADENGWYQILVREPVERLIGWNRSPDGRESLKEYTDGHQDARIEFSFLQEE